MWCTRLGFIFILVSTFCLLVSSAPSEKRANIKNPTKSTKAKLLLLKQADEPLRNNNANKNDEIHEWWPSVDLTNDFDYQSDNKTNSEQNEKSINVIHKEDQSKVVAQKKENKKSTVKTICEDGSKGSKCSSSSSGSPPKSTQPHAPVSDSNQQKQALKSGDADVENLQGLLEAMKKSMDNKESLDKNEVKHLFELLTSLTKKVDQLQQNVNECKNKHSSDLSLPTAPLLHPRGRIAEIEEKHIVERKLVNAKDHQEESQKGLNKAKTAAQKSAPPASPANDAHDSQSTLTKTQSGESLSSQFTNDANYYSAIPTHNSYNGGSNQVAADLTLQSQPSSANNVQTSIVETSIVASNSQVDEPVNSENQVNYLSGVPAEVSFNGGINKPMDVLKQQYPDGYWPEDAVLPDAPKNDIDDSEENTSEEYPDENDYYEDSDDPAEHYKEYNNTLDELTPQYLENIIKKEWEIRDGNNRKMSLIHHVQEHKVQSRK